MQEATTKRATVVFKRVKKKKKKNFLKHRNGTRFNVYNRLYYLNTVNCDGQYDQCNECWYLQTWREILGHSNYDDIQKLQSVVDGMKVRVHLTNLPYTVMCVLKKSLYKTGTRIQILEPRQL